MSWSVGNMHWYRQAGPPPRSVYVGRPGRGNPGSPLANPFATEPNKSQTVIVVPDPIRAYRQWLAAELAIPNSLAMAELARLAAQADGELLCFCAPAPCHAEVISRAIDWFRRQPLAIQAIALTQPWASLVAGGEKRIETRGWQRKYRGLLGIYACKGLADMDQDEYEDLCASSPFAESLSRCGYRSAAELPRGGIIAVAMLHGIEPITPAMLPAEPERSFGNYGPKRFAWYLSHVWPLPRMVPWRGQQGMFPVTLQPDDRWPVAEVEAGIEQGIETAR